MPRAGYGERGQETRDRAQHRATLVIGQRLGEDVRQVRRAGNLARHHIGAAEGAGRIRGERHHLGRRHAGRS